MNDATILFGLALAVLVAVIAWLLWQDRIRTPRNPLRMLAFACIVAVAALALCSVMAGVILATWPAEAVEALRSA